MARLYYMSLPGVGDWSAAMGASGAQLAPYRTYLSTARTAAENHALSLAWRLPSDVERSEFERRRHGRAAQLTARRSAQTGQDIICLIDLFFGLYCLHGNDKIEAWHTKPISCSSSSSKRTIAATSVEAE